MSKEKEIDSSEATENVVSAESEGQLGELESFPRGIAVYIRGEGYKISDAEVTPDIIRQTIIPKLEADLEKSKTNPFSTDELPERDLNLCDEWIKKKEDDIGEEVKSVRNELASEPAGSSEPFDQKAESTVEETPSVSSVVDEMVLAIKEKKLSSKTATDILNLFIANTGGIDTSREFETDEDEDGEALLDKVELSVKKRISLLEKQGMAELDIRKAVINELIEQKKRLITSTTGETSADKKEDSTPEPSISSAQAGTAPKPRFLPDDVTFNAGIGERISKGEQKIETDDILEQARKHTEDVINGKWEESIRLINMERKHGAKGGMLGWRTGMHNLRKFFAGDHLNSENSNLEATSQWLGRNKDKLKLVAGVLGIMVGGPAGWTIGAAYIARGAVEMGKKKIYTEHKDESGLSLNEKIKASEVAIFAYAKSLAKDVTEAIKNEEATEQAKFNAIEKLIIAKQKMESGDAEFQIYKNGNGDSAIRIKDEVGDGLGEKIGDPIKVGKLFQRSQKIERIAGLAEGFAGLLAGGIAGHYQVIHGMRDLGAATPGVKPIEGMSDIKSLPKALFSAKEWLINIRHDTVLASDYHRVGQGAKGTWNFFYSVAEKLKHTAEHGVLNANDSKIAEGALMLISSYLKGLWLVGATTVPGLVPKGESAESRKKTEVRAGHYEKFLNQVKEQNVGIESETTTKDAPKGEGIEAKSEEKSEEVSFEVNPGDIYYIDDPLAEIGEGDEKVKNYTGRVEIIQDRKGWKLKLIDNNNKEISFDPTEENKKMLGKMLGEHAQEGAYSPEEREELEYFEGMGILGQVGQGKRVVWRNEDKLPDSKIIKGISYIILNTKQKIERRNEIIIVPDSDNLTRENRIRLKLTDILPYVKKFEEVSEPADGSSRESSSEAKSEASVESGEALTGVKKEADELEKKLKSEGLTDFEVKIYRNKNDRITVSRYQDHSVFIEDVKIQERFKDIKKGEEKMINVVFSGVRVQTKGTNSWVEIVVKEKDSEDVKKK